MAKKNKTTKTSAPRYAIGTELLFSDEKTMMEKCSIQKIEEDGYLLSNRMKVNFSLRRTDGRDGHCILLNEDAQARFDAYFAHMVILRTAPEVIKEIDKMDKMNLTLEQAQVILKVNKYINKIKTLLQ